ncbi:MAG: DegT/DnrJ/EryC1/StrS family aminotransferase [Brevirhabdus sp.]
MPLIPFHLPHFDDSDRAAAVAVMDSRFTTMGAEVAAFEEEFAALHDRAHAVMVNSCTNGHLLVYQYLRRVKAMPEGTRTVMPATTFAGPAFQAAHSGFTVDFADTDPTTGTSPAQAFLAKASNEAPCLLGPMPYGGIPMSDMAELMAQASERGHLVIEDCAHACGTRYDSGARVGSLPSYASIYSFYPTKVLNATEGGMILTEDGELADWCRKARLHGVDKSAVDRYRGAVPDWSYAIPVMGHKCNPTNIQAAIGRSQLARLDSTIEKLRGISAVYRAAAAEAGLQGLVGQAGGNQHLFVLRDTPRDALIAHLRAHEVQFSMHYPPLWKMEAWGAPRHDELPGAERFAAGCLSLPIFASMSEEQVAQVAGAIRSFRG